METVFMVYNLVFIMKMTVYTIWLVCLKGRASAISFYGWGLLLGFRIEWIIPYEKPEYWRFVVNLKHSVRYDESLVVSNSRNQTSPKPIIYVDIWIYNFTHRESYYSSRTYGQPGITALPRITADECHKSEQPLLLSYKTQTNITF